MPEIAVMLHNIRSAHNVGSIFRTCDAAGISHVFLTGYTPRPIDRFGRPQKDIAKTALGAQSTVSWQHAASPRVLIQKLKGEGWHIAGVEQDARAIDYRRFSPRPKTLYILGNEVRGISAQLKSVCDSLVEIPMYGKKESLNVSVAAGVILFGARRDQ